jgi:hypothetical protein
LISRDPEDEVEKEGSQSHETETQADDTNEGKENKQDDLCVASKVKEVSLTAKFKI